MMAETIERCGGCGVGARVGNGKAGFPWSAVMSEEDAKELPEIPEQEPSQRGFVTVPVCDACHRDPEHRVYPLKAHFFPRVAEQQAKAAAGSNQIG